MLYRSFSCINICVRIYLFAQFSRTLPLVTTFVFTLFCKTFYIWLGSKRSDLRQIWGYWRGIYNKSNKPNSSVKKEFSDFSYIRLQKQHSSLMYWLKICKAWVRSQLRWAWNWLKLKVTSSNVLRIIIHWLSARRDVGLTQGSLIPKEHSLYRALKHSIRQHKLDLNSSKTTASANSNKISLKLQISYHFRQLVNTELEYRPALGKNLGPFQTSQYCHAELNWSH